MARDQNRDASFDRLLRQWLPSRRSSSPGSCLDAEMLAAWAEGTLGRAERAAAEKHLADCARCQSMVAAFARSLPTSAESPSRKRALNARWLVPLAAASLVAVFWVVGSRQARQPTLQKTAAPASATVTPAAEPVDAIRGRTPPPQPAAPNLQAKAETGTPPEIGVPARQTADERRLEKLETVQQPPVAGGIGPLAEAVTVMGQAPAVTAPASAAPAMAPIEIVSPTPSIRWRIGAGGLIQRSTDGGASWETQSAGTIADLLAGSSVSGTVCWVVGRSGTVLVTSDGREWRSVAFPESVDLVAVRALDARTATVTAAPGQLFRTTDGGATWAPVQGF